MIIEDEPLAQDKLMDYVESIPTLNLVGTAANAKRAIPIALSVRPDLIFLDIRMPGMTGYDLLRQWPAPLPIIIVTSAYEQYALEGYKFSVIDYLLKPIEFDAFALAVRKVEARMGIAAPNQETSIDSVNNEVWASKTALSFKDGSTMINVPLDQIIYCESAKNYMMIYTHKQYYVTRLQISKLETILPQVDFMRISRSHIVRKSEIQSVSLKDSKVILFNMSAFRFGITYRSVLEEYIKNSLINS